MQKSEQPPASLVAVASVHLQAAPPNAKCGQGLCFTRGLTLQSRGLAPASRVKPLISNVRHRQMQSVEASCQHRHSNLQRSIGFVPSEHISPMAGQKVGPPRAHAVTHGGTRLASFLVLRRVVFSGSRRTARFSSSAAISRQCTLVAWCGYQGHGQPLALKGEFVSSREASVVCGLRGRYSAFWPAVAHACAWPLPNPSINRTSPGKPGAACYLNR